MIAALAAVGILLGYAAFLVVVIGTTMGSRIRANLERERVLRERLRRHDAEMLAWVRRQYDDREDDGR